SFPPSCSSAGCFPADGSSLLLETVSLQKWDPSLKLMAETYAAKCIWNHNPELEDTGENLFAGTGPLDLRQAVEKWFLERLDYSFQNNTCDEDKMCGHYTQMVWADTHRVGCALHFCNSMEGLNWDQRTIFLVCNYFPASFFGLNCSFFLSPPLHLLRLSLSPPQSPPLPPPSPPITSSISPHHLLRLPHHLLHLSPSPPPSPPSPPPSPPITSSISPHHLLRL
uniref:SCP domain-containing protein n=1 Tax=Kryptolebias marmoratus TaxID=37003 RepID=A0A3Q2ZBH6_KRYMA